MSDPITDPTHERPTTQSEGKYKQTLPSVYIKPLEEAQDFFTQVDQAKLNKSSFARMSTGFSGKVEVGLNKQITLELSLGYIFMAMSAYFDRDTVSLPGVALFFRSYSESEFTHANDLIDQQNRRGGRVEIGAIAMPDSDYNNEDKGDALYAMLTALALVKMNMGKMRELHGQCEECDDHQTSDFIEEMMEEQARVIKEVSNYVAELERVGKGYGVWHVDERLQEEGRYGATLGAEEM